MFARQIYKRMSSNGRGFFTGEFLAKQHKKHLVAINKITSSVSIRYYVGSMIKKVDIGLKIRHAGKKLHIPNDVRYSERQNHHNPDRPFQTWEYSHRAAKVIVDYLAAFPFIEDYLVWENQNEKNQRHQGGNNTSRQNFIEDLLPFEEDPDERIRLLEEASAWIESNEFINEKFVPAGFQFMDLDIVNEIDSKLTEMKVQSETTPQKTPSLIEGVQNRFIFAETWPYWTSPFKTGIYDFDFGDRIVNVNTSKKNFVGFGEFGTVIGFTNSEVVILFDNQNISLSNVYDRCMEYRGAMVTPQSVINLTQNLPQTENKNKATNMRKTAKSFKPYPNKGDQGTSQGKKKPEPRKDGNPKQGKMAGGWGGFDPHQKKGGADAAF